MEEKSEFKTHNSQHEDTPGDDDKTPEAETPVGSLDIHNQMDPVLADLSVQDQMDPVLAEMHRLYYSGLRQLPHEALADLSVQYQMDPVQAEMHRLYYSGLRQLQL